MRCRRMMFPANIWIKSNERSGFTAPPREFLNRAGLKATLHAYSLRPHHVKDEGLIRHYQPPGPIWCQIWCHNAPILAVFADSSDY
jgi:hypothetical protein